MRLEIQTKDSTGNITITDLDKVQHNYDGFVLKEEWYKLTIPGTRYNIIDILVDGESIRHYLNAGLMSDKDIRYGYTVILLKCSLGSRSV